MPEVVVDAGPVAVERFLEFFAAAIANGSDAGGVRAGGGEVSGLVLVSGPDVAGDRAAHHVAAPTSRRARGRSRPSSCTWPRSGALCDWLVVHQVLSANPAASVRGPKHVVTKGATPVLTPTETRELLDRIDTGTLVGLRDGRETRPRPCGARTRRVETGDAGESCRGVSRRRRLRGHEGTAVSERRPGRARSFRWATTALPACILVANESRSLTCSERRSWKDKSRACSCGRVGLRRTDGRRIGRGSAGERVSLAGPPRGPGACGNRCTSFTTSARYRCGRRPGR